MLQTVTIGAAGAVEDGGLGALDVIVGGIELAVIVEGIELAIIVGEVVLHVGGDVTVAAFPIPLHG